MKKLFLLFGISMLCFSISAQTDGKKTLKFSETNPDFYNVQEIDGVVSHDLLITNLGENEVKLIGYTSENPAVRYEWKQNVLKKYDKIHIKAILDPKGMRYSFKIPTTILTLVGMDTVKYDIRLSGYVHPTPTTKEEIYGMQEGNLKYKNNTITIKSMHRNEVYTDTIRFYNVWDSVMTFRPGTLPPAIKIVDLTKEVQPRTEGYVVYSYSAAAKNDWGSVWDRFTLQTNDPLPKEHNNYKTFYVITDIYDDFESWTKEQLRNAPHILVDSEEFNFGQCYIGDVINHGFTLQNIGKSTLTIHKVKTSCGCTTSDLEKNTLEPGESTKIKARFNTYGKRGGQVKEIFVITNDPEQPKVTLKIMGKVVEKPKEQN